MNSDLKPIYDGQPVLVMTSILGETPESNLSFTGLFLKEDETWVHLGTEREGITHSINKSLIVVVAKSDEAPQDRGLN